MKSWRGLCFVHLFAPRSQVEVCVLPRRLDEPELFAELLKLCLVSFEVVRIKVLHDTVVDVLIV